MDRKTLFLQADEIDHITIRYTDFGENLKRKESIKKILFYNSCYKEVSFALSQFDISRDKLNELSDEELYKILVIVRTVLLGMVKDCIYG